MASGSPPHTSLPKRICVRRHSLFIPEEARSRLVADVLLAVVLLLRHGLLEGPLILKDVFAMCPRHRSVLTLKVAVQDGQQTDLGSRSVALAPRILRLTLILRMSQPYIL